jgi:uncharacterized protein YccT (UPF0319 family)
LVQNANKKAPPFSRTPFHQLIDEGGKNAAVKMTAKILRKSFPKSINYIKFLCRQFFASAARVLSVI